MNNALPSKKLSEQPIELPESKFLTSLKDFGLDEILAGCIDVVSTSIASVVMSESTKLIWLPFMGPITEKLMFFPAHIYQARKIYKTVPKSSRQSFFYYLKKGLKDGLGNLIKDVLIHDPMYILLMFLGLNFIPGIPAGVLSFTSYVLAILTVAGIDLLRDEFKFFRFKRKLKKFGFGVETYYESRFYIVKDQSRTELINDLSKTFNLKDKYPMNYSDEYFENSLPEFLGKASKLRIRSRTPSNMVSEKKHPILNTLQMVYTRVNERRKKYDQFRYFITKKEKVYFRLSDKSNRLELLENNSSTRLFKKYISPNPGIKRLKFERFVCRDNELAICVDKNIGSLPFYIVEIKVYSDLKRMEEAMRYIMLNYPVIQTTQGKSDWLN